MNPPALSPDPPIRLALVELLPQVSAFVRRFLVGPGFEVLPDLRDRSELPGLLAEEPVDVVIVPTERSGFAREYHDLLKTNPDIKVLTISTTSFSADLHELCFLGKNVGEEGLVEAVRAVARRQGFPAVDQPGVQPVRRPP